MLSCFCCLLSLVSTSLVVYVSCCAVLCGRVMCSSAPSTSAAALPNLLVIGTPGCGKSSLCARVSELTGLRHIEVGSLVRDRSLHTGWDSLHSAYTLDDDKLCDCLEVELAGGGCLVDFHSTSTFPVRWFALVVVVRCDNSILHDRLSRRGYSAMKVEENVECEIMQVCLDEAREAWDERAVVELQNDTIEQLDDNAERCKQWLMHWQADHPTQPS